MVFWGVLIIPKLLINDSWLIDCNTFWNIFGTTKTVTKSGPSGPVFITRILQQIQEQYGGIFETYDFYILESEIVKMAEGLST